MSKMDNERQCFLNERLSIQSRRIEESLDKEWKMGVSHLNFSHISGYLQLLSTYVTSLKGRHMHVINL